jgi:hypothetical protein
MCNSLTKIWCEFTSLLKQKPTNCKPCDEFIEEAMEIRQSELAKRSSSSISSLANSMSIGVTGDVEPSKEKREFLMCL